jgi:hypothetical protein
MLHMRFYRRYWILIGTAVFCAAVSSLSTLYLASANPAFRECNSVAAACFLQIGMVPCMALGILSLPPVMVAIPHLLRQNERPGLLSVLILSCITLYTAFDAINNLSAILGYHEAYLAAHAVLDTTNNVTGTVVGTGESLC